VAKSKHTRVLGFGPAKMTAVSVRKHMEEDGGKTETEPCFGVVC
jgi:hypothetical protein